jgi:hypothetical protein
MIGSGQPSETGAYRPVADVIGAMIYRSPEDATKRTRDLILARQSSIPRGAQRSERCSGDAHCSGIAAASYPSATPRPAGSA